MGIISTWMHLRVVLWMLGVLRVQALQMLSSAQLAWVAQHAGVGLEQ